MQIADSGPLQWPAIWLWWSLANGGRPTMEASVETVQCESLLASIRSAAL